jgi:deoxycytidylate deaminase
MKASEIYIYQKNDPHNTITGIVDNRGNLYCTECAKRLEKEGNAIFVMNSHLSKANTEPCDSCQKLIPIAW